MKHLPSKLIAGGLSAAAILIWWPHLFATDGMGSWFIRGVVWTLAFELLLMALTPLEEVIWDHTRIGKAASARMEAAKTRVIGEQSIPRKALSLGLIATFAVAIPLGLMFQGEPVKAEKPVQKVEVTKVYKVYKPVRVEEVTKTVVVEKEVPVVKTAPSTQKSPKTTSSEPNKKKETVNTPPSQPDKDTSTETKEPVAPEKETPVTEPTPTPATQVPATTP